MTIGQNKKYVMTLEGYGDINVTQAVQIFNSKDEAISWIDPRFLIEPIEKHGFKSEEVKLELDKRKKEVCQEMGLNPDEFEIIENRDYFASNQVIIRIALWKKGLS